MEVLVFLFEAKIGGRCKGGKDRKEGRKDNAAVVTGRAQDVCEGWMEGGWS